MKPENVSFLFLTSFVLLVLPFYVYAIEWAFKKLPRKINWAEEILGKILKF